MDTDVSPIMVSPSGLRPEHSPSSLFPLASITVNRPARQRREITPASLRGLMASISKRGLINPLLVERTGALIAGERRLEACRALGWAEVPVTFRDQMTPRELQLLEADENLHREGLTWQETAGLVGRIHRMFLEDSPQWTQAQTAEAQGLIESEISRYLKLDEELRKEAPHPKVAGATNYREAINVLARKEARAEDIAREGLIRMTSEAFEAEGASGPGPGASVAGETPAEAPPPEPEVICASALDFFTQYSGPRFNLLHCDFPYGIGAFSGPQMASGTPDEYNDSQDIYWALLEAMLGNIDRIMSGAGHMLFWYSNRPEIEARTRHLFTTLAPSLRVWRFPLIWLKSDNAGVAPEPTRGPRHVYETALFASRGDRQIVGIKADAHAGPTDNKLHPSAKPVPVLRHFMAMLVDETTSMLDPTCGAGSSLIAADSLGASRVQGIEQDPGFASVALRALANARALRGASAAANGL